jgi:hypothetical protein
VDELDYQQAVNRAAQRMLSNRLPLGIAVRRWWVDHEADGIRALIVIVDRRSHRRAPKPVLVPRAREWVDVDALETEVENYALNYPRATALPELLRDIASGSPALGVRLEDLWLEGNAA